MNRGRWKLNRGKDKEKEGKRDRKRNREEERQRCNQRRVQKKLNKVRYFFAHNCLFCDHGNLTKGEGSVQLTS